MSNDIVSYGEDFYGLGHGSLPTKTIRERIRESIDWVVGGESFAWACYHGFRSDSRIRGWQFGPSIPRRQDIENVLKRFGIDPAKLKNLSDDEWKAYLRTLPKGLPPSVTQRRWPSWLLTTIDLAAKCASIDPASTVIVVSALAKDQTNPHFLRTTVLANAERGVSYLYVVPKDCDRRHGLIRWSNMLQERGVSGSINLMVPDVTQNDPLLRSLRNAVLVTHPGVKCDSNTIAMLEPDDILEAVYQVTVPEDGLTSEAIWGLLPHHLLAQLVEEIQRWYGGADWYWANTTVRH